MICIYCSFQEKYILVRKAMDSGATYIGMGVIEDDKGVLKAATSLRLSSIIMVQNRIYNKQEGNWWIFCVCGACGILNISHRIS
jgi:hypothetical protein